MASASTHHQEDDGGETWELVRAFAEDTNSIMGTIWPPRSYNCSYCRREFRSAQALGGHMNVHRRDRANNYYQQTHNYNNPSSAAAAPTSTTSTPPAADLSSNKFVPPPNPIDSREPAALCLLCQFRSPSSRSAGTAFGGPLSLDDACLKETVIRGGGGGGGFIFHSNWCRPNGSCCSLVPPPSTADLKNAASSARMVELVSVVTTAEPESNNDINAGSSSSSVKELSGGLELDLELRLGHIQGTR